MRLVVTITVGRFTVGFRGSRFVDRGLVCIGFVGGTVVRRLWFVVRRSDRVVLRRESAAPASSAATPSSRSLRAACGPCSGWACDWGWGPTPPVGAACAAAPPCAAPPCPCPGC